MCSLSLVKLVGKCDIKTRFWSVHKERCRKESCYVTWTLLRTWIFWTIPFTQAFIFLELLVPFSQTLIFRWFFCIVFSPKIRLNSDYDYWLKYCKRQRIKRSLTFILFYSKTDIFKNILMTWALPPTVIKM